MIIQSKNVWIDQQLQPAQIEMQEGKIVKIYPYGKKAVDQDFQQQWILPGFIDIHTHGWNRCDAGKPTLESMLKWKKHMPKEGVTSFLATTATQSEQLNKLAMPILKEVIETQKEGAEILGINIEGNYISHQFHGAQDLYTIVKPDASQLLEYHELSGHHILSVILAPEFDEDGTFTKAVTAANIRISCGHSGATYAQVSQAVVHGATGITHCGNGMRPFHHREPGIFGAALNIDDLYVECIGDGIHVHFETAYLIGTMKGKDRFILVTDSADCKDDETYAQYNSEGAFRLADGTLFGSALYMNQGVYNLIHHAHLPLVTAINAATINPAVYLGVADRKGSIEEGKDADLVITNEHLNVVQTYCHNQAQL